MTTFSYYTTFRILRRFFQTFFSLANPNLSLSLSLTHTIFMYRSFLHILFLCIDHSFSHVFLLIHIHILLTYNILFILFIRAFYRLPVYSFTSLFRSFFCYLYVLILRIYLFDPNSQRILSHCIFCASYCVFFTPNLLGGIRSCRRVADIYRSRMSGFFELFLVPKRFPLFSGIQNSWED